MNEAATDLTSYQVYAENGNYYISASDLQRFCESSGNFDVDYMLGRICSANSISEAIVVYDYCDDYFVEALSESNVLIEKGC